jgi:anti-anti-sigma factor
MDESQVHAEEIADHVWVIGVRGEYDLANVGQIDQAVADVFAAGSAALLDFTETTFIDSSVLNAIVRAHETAARSAAHRLLVIAPRGGEPRRVIDLSLPADIAVYEGVPDAVAELRSP